MGLADARAQSNMDRSDLFNTNTVTLNDLLANGRVYRVPPYQRDYSWTEENWEDLWQDVVEIAAADQQHYMGSIVLQQSEHGLTVIDGQQRLATLSVLVLAALAQLQRLCDEGVDANDNAERLRLLKAQYIGTKDPASLRASSKLFLNENDDGFYQEYLVQFRVPINPRKLRESQQRLWNAYRFFFERIAERFQASRTGSDLANFLNQAIGQRLIFIQIRVQNELSAFTVFETLNARGLELTATDLLKNYLFSLSAKSEVDLQHVRRQWQRLTDIVPLKEFPDFLRHYLNSKQRYIRRERLFKELRGATTNRQQVFDLLDQLEAAAGWYCALDDHNDDHWQDFPESIKYVRALNLFRAKQYKPIILACARNGITRLDLERVLRACAVVAYRYQMIGQRNPSRLEEVYNGVAMAIHDAKVVQVRRILDDLKPVYLADEEFKSAFEGAALATNSKKKLVMYTLCSLENHRSSVDLDFESATATIEHILPENPSADWDEDFPPDDRERYVYRLGNCTLLERNANRSIANQGFPLKRQAYAQSQYRITQEIEAENWTPDAIRRRQAEMAKWATSVWRID
jgi:uncharacterized protein with ParB-like and HNH nuclease domain